MVSGDAILVVGIAAVFAIVAILFLDRFMSRNYAFSIGEHHAHTPSCGARRRGGVGSGPGGTLWELARDWAAR